MIEKMNKLTLLLYHEAKEEILRKLQDFGIVHLEFNSTSQDEEILTLKNEINELKRIERLLKYSLPKDKDIPEAETYDGTIENLIEEIENHKDKSEHLLAHIEHIEKEIQMIEPWGNFNPELIDKLKENSNLKATFYTIAKKNFSEIELDDSNYLFIVSEVKGMIHFVVFSSNEEVSEIPNAMIERFPLKSINKLKAEVQSLQKQYNDETESLIDYYKYLHVIHTKISEIENKLTFALANVSLESDCDDKVKIITGWIPQKNKDELIDFLKDKELAYIIDNPSEEDKIPVKLKNNAFVKLFEPIGQLYTLPEYKELDPTPFFAPFFMLFFGMCFADLGYGIILSLLSLVLIIVLKGKMKKFGFLGLFFGFSTIFAGFMLDTFFGTSISKMNPQVVQYMLFPVSEGNGGPMLMAIIIGIVQVLLGLILQMVNNIQNKGFIAGLQPIGTALILIGASFSLMTGKLLDGMGGKDLMVGSKIPLGEIIYSVPTDPLFFFGGIAIVGVVVVLLFNSPDKPIFIRPLTGLWELYGIGSGLLGDILSYIRLFALGLAGGLLGGAFNEIAFMTKDIPVAGWFLTGLIMLIGHTLNFGLAALGAFVHPLRLTFVEFYKAVGFTGGGKPYTPFSNKK